MLSEVVINFATLVEGLFEKILVAVLFNLGKQVIGESDKGIVLGHEVSFAVQLKNGGAGSVR